MARPRKPDSEKAIKQSVSFTPEQLDRVIKYCQREERSISWCVRKALDQWLEDLLPFFSLCFGGNEW